MSDTITEQLDALLYINTFSLPYIQNNNCVHLLHTLVHFSGYRIYFYVSCYVMLLKRVK